MLARIAQELFWLGRDLTRAEHTARMLDGVFHAEIGGVDSLSLRLSWDAVLAVIGAMPPEPEVAGVDAVVLPGTPIAADIGPEEVLHMLTLDEANPASVAACIARARERALRLRDVISTEMWEAVNIFETGFRRRAAEEALQAGPYGVLSYVRRRTALFWGLVYRTMVRDEARAFLEAGGRLEAADMVLRMLRVAIPPEDHAVFVGAGSDNGSAGESRAIALLHAVGGAQAYSRTVRQRPTAGPVARFLLFEHGYPGSVASAAQELRELLAQIDPRLDSPPVLRVARLIADLDFQARMSGPGETVTLAVSRVQEEFAEIDTDLAARYFAGSETAL